MGLFALTPECVQGISREQWGNRIGDANKLARILVDKGILSFDEVGDLSADPGVNLPFEELRARLASQAPIKMPGTLELIKPKNAPAIKIIRSHGDGGGDVIQYVNIAQSVNEITNQTNITVVDPPENSEEVEIEILTDVSASVSVSGCTATISLTKTFQTIRFRGTRN